MSKSRIKNSVRNVKSGVIYQFVHILFAFATRTVFISVLGQQYLGINSLFANIVSMLSLTELGVATAITFRMYKPLADGDIQRQRVLMKFYKLAYRYIGLVIFTLGMITLPFIPNFMTGLTVDINVYLFFFLYLMRTCVTYWFFSYKRTIISADQKTYIIRRIDTIYQFATNTIQIIVLIVTKDFLIYTLSFILIKVIENIIVARKAEQLYPYIKEETEENLSKEEVKELFKDCYALFFYKVNSRVLSSTDNIVISTFVGLVTVGLYSNYLLIIQGVKTLTSIVVNSITASVGSLNAGDNERKKLKIFFQLNYMISMIYILLSVIFFISANYFVGIWIGENYLLPNSFIIIIAVDLFTSGLCVTLGMFRESMGLFQQAKYRPLISSIVNISLSLILVQYIGIHGVILATIITRMTTYFIFDPNIIFKYGFNKSSSEYFYKSFYYAFIFSISIACSYFFINQFDFNNFVMLILGSISSFVITSLSIFIFTFKSREFKDTLKTIDKIIKNIIDKRFRNK